MKILCKVFFFFCLAIRYSLIRPTHKVHGLRNPNNYSCARNNFIPFLCCICAYICANTEQYYNHFHSKKFSLIGGFHHKLFGFDILQIGSFFLKKCLLVNCLTSKANSNIMNGFSPAIPYSWFRNLLFFKSIFLSWWKKQKVFNWIAIFRNMYNRTIFLHSTGLLFKNSVQHIRPIFIFC